MKGAGLSGAARSRPLHCCRLVTGVNTQAVMASQDLDAVFVRSALKDKESLFHRLMEKHRTDRKVCHDLTFTAGSAQISPLQTLLGYD